MPRPILLGPRATQQPDGGWARGEAVEFDADALVRHAFVCGASGSGKTVFCKGLVEEAVLAGIPVVAIDLKGDLASLALTGRHARAEALAQVFGDEGPVVATEFAQGAEAHGLDPARAQRYAERAHVRLFTPNSSLGRRVALSALPSFPDPPSTALEREERDELVQALVLGFAHSMYGTPAAVKKNEPAVKVVEELVRWCANRGEALEGVSGISRILDLVREPPFESMGGMPLEQYLPVRDKQRLMQKLNSRLLGAERSRYEGPRLCVETLLDGVPQGKVALSIVYLGHISDFTEQASIVGLLCADVYRWMRKTGGSTGVRLMMYVDELGGGDAKHAFYPSAPHNPPSKAPLNLLVRQGRSAGVSMVLATQNPMSVDVRGLGNINTWGIGRLTRKNDHARVEDLLERLPQGPPTPQQVVSHLPQGVMLAMSDALQGPTFVFGRWLYSIHRQLAPGAVGQISQMTDERPPDPVTPPPPEPLKVVADPPTGTGRRRKSKAPEATSEGTAEATAEVTIEATPSGPRPAVAATEKPAPKRRRTKAPKAAPAPTPTPAPTRTAPESVPAEALGFGARARRFFADRLGMSKPAPVEDEPEATTEGDEHPDPEEDQPVRIGPDRSTPTPSPTRTSGATLAATTRRPAPASPTAPGPTPKGISPPPETPATAANRPEASDPGPAAPAPPPAARRRSMPRLATPSLDPGPIALPGDPADETRSRAPSVEALAPTEPAPRPKTSRSRATEPPTSTTDRMQRAHAPPRRRTDPTISGATGVTLADQTIADQTIAGTTHRLKARVQPDDETHAAHTAARRPDGGSTVRRNAVSPTEAATEVAEESSAPGAPSVRKRTTSRRRKRTDAEKEASVAAPPAAAEPRPVTGARPGADPASTTVLRPRPRPLAPTDLAALRAEEDTPGPKPDGAAGTKWVRETPAPPTSRVAAPPAASRSAAPAPVTTGPAAATVERPAPPASPPVPKPVEAGPSGWILHHGGRSWPVPAGGALTIGRSPRADAQIADVNVSRLHLELAPDGPALTLKRLKEQNPIWLDGRPMSADMRLEPRQGTWTLKLGNSEVLLTWASPTRGR